MNNKECVAVLSTDMSKAFVSLRHALIIKKLEAYGFSGMPLELVRSYFTERKNCIKINNVTSTWKNQLSIGNAMELVSKRTISKCTHLSSDLFMYADDHQVYQTGSSIKAIISELIKEA